VALLGHGTATGVEAADLQALAADLPGHGITVALITQPDRVNRTGAGSAPARAAARCLYSVTASRSCRRWRVVGVSTPSRRHASAVVRYTSSKRAATATETLGSSLRRCMHCGYEASLLRASSCPQPYVKQVTQRIADEVQRHDGQCDAGADREDQPPVAILHVLDTDRELVAPVDARVMQAETKEAQPGTWH
jgi:hypothetical protein